MRGCEFGDTQVGMMPLPGISMRGLRGVTVISMSMPKRMSETIGFRLLLDDYELIVGKAEAKGVSVAEYLRRIATAFARGQLVPRSGRVGDTPMPIVGDTRRAIAGSPGGHAVGHGGDTDLAIARPVDNFGDTRQPMEPAAVGDTRSAIAVGTRVPAHTSSSGCRHSRFVTKPFGRVCERCGAISVDQGDSWKAPETP